MTEYLHLDSELVSYLHSYQKIQFQSRRALSERLWVSAWGCLTDADSLASLGSLRTGLDTGIISCQGRGSKRLLPGMDKAGTHVSRHNAKPKSSD